MSDSLSALDRTIATMTSRLLDARNSAGHWEGRLASSALATATATMALTLAHREKRAAALLPDENEEEGARQLLLARAGLQWLVATQNSDGGWGDTVLSFSNLSTTALCWAALSLGRAGSEEPADLRAAAIDRAEVWLRAQIGELSEDRIRNAVIQRYGKDRTFSVPILTVLTLAGRLGTGADAWRRVPQLPFELAACPHQWFQWLRLPVVSYALPALVAMGHARHHQAPTRNPVLRSIRSGLRLRTLAMLREMQPASGGYLEATPLTSFVVMSLISAGQVGHPVVRDGLGFLCASARADGSWPIDTNLATWVTTLSINALAKHGLLSEADRSPVLEWLLAQQRLQEDPYTHAAPGGWAWTDLSGGVLDVDDTAGAVLALWNLAGVEARGRAAAEAGIRWLLGVRNRDGGTPTFCRGWGALPFDRSAADLTAHTLEAWSVWFRAVAPALQSRLARAASDAIRYLAGCQNADGSWSPLWFGNQHVHGEANLTYGTARVVAALGTEIARSSPEAARCRRRGIGWLLTAQNADGGWGGGAGAPSSIEETGIALQALGSSAMTDPATAPAAAVRRGVSWMIATTEEGRRTDASPIGLYFARLWYFEEMYPIVFALAGLLETRAAVTNLTLESHPRCSATP
jgi:squalene-hopene/tetraprenyl-beta-curcumene cyclase